MFSVCQEVLQCKCHAGEGERLPRDVAGLKQGNFQAFFAGGMVGRF